LSIKETLPRWQYAPGGPNYSHPLHAAVRELAWAMQYEQDGKHRIAVLAVQQALALVRYYRENSPDQGRRADDKPPEIPDRYLLAQAACWLMNYVSGRIDPIPSNIRFVESNLRTWLRRRER